MRAHAISNDRECTSTEIFIVARGNERAKDACGIISPEIKYRLRAIKRKSRGMFYKSSVLIRFYFTRKKIIYRNENNVFEKKIEIDTI